MKLTQEELEAFGEELDALRRRIIDDLGEEDAAYIRGIVKTQRGFEVAGRRGSAAHDPLVWTDADGYQRTSNLSGGLEGGISTGEPIVVQAAMKPLATLNRPTLATVDTATKEPGVSFKERTDVTAVPALGVVAEHMVALVLADEAARKFGGDSVAELVRNAEASARAIAEGPVGA